MYIKLTDKLIEHAEDITLTNYRKIKGIKEDELFNLINIEDIEDIIFDLIQEYEDLEEKFKDFRQDVEDNYRKIEVEEQL